MDEVKRWSVFFW